MTNETPWFMEMPPCGAPKTVEVEDDSDAAKYQAAVAKHMSPPGALGLPPLLDARRIEWTIPDGAFDFDPLFDFVYVYQIPLFAEETYGKGSRIIRAQVTQAREEREASRGILISAGLGALDKLRSHGVDVGHIVRFIRIAPFRQTIAVVDGEYEYVLGLQTGDVRASEDLVKMRRAGKARIVLRELEDGTVEHRLEDEEGRAYKPMTPWIAEDM